MAVETAIGRVVPSYEGPWDASIEYKKLDNVLRNGSTYIAIQDNINKEPEDQPNYWQLIAQKGDQGEIGPKGDKGDKGDTGDTGPRGPKGDSGSGSVSSVDGILPGDVSTDFDVPLHAIRYDTQELGSTQQMIARNNINAQVAGNYIISPNTKTIGDFLKYAGNDIWITSEVDVFPSGGRTGYYLSKIDNGTEWAPIHQVTSGGTEHSVLVKNSDADYDYGWSPAITDSDIDAIVNK